jgi:RecB family exonuclease
MNASHSKMSTFRRCRRKYHWAYTLNKDTGRSDGQVVGTVGHSVLAMYYMERNRLANIEQACLTKAESKGLDMGLAYDDIARLQRALVKYFEYADDYDVAIDVQSVEKKVTKQIGKHTIEGYIDLIGTLPDGKHIAMEHKFQKRPDISNVALDPQIDMYTWLGDVDIVMFNIINVTTAKNTKTAPVLREQVERTPEHIDIFLANIEAQLDEMEEFDGHAQKARYAYPSPDATCSWQCGFYESCKAFQTTGNFSVIEDLPARIFDREAGRDA